MIPERIAKARRLDHRDPEKQRQHGGKSQQA